MPFAHAVRTGDPLLRTLDTSVVSATIAQPPAAPAQKKGKKAVLAPEVPNEPLLHVLLHDTVIFPEGGGQPTDTGRITTLADGATWEVVQAKRHGGHAVHYVKLHEGIDADTALLSFQAGAKVTVALGDEGYERRYDHVSHTSSLEISGACADHSADVNAYLSAHAFCSPRNQAESADALVVPH